MTPPRPSELTPPPQSTDLPDAQPAASDMLPAHAPAGASTPADLELGRMDPHIMEALIQVSMAINTELDVSEILNKVVHWTRVLISCSDASVLMWNPETEAFVQGASTNHQDVAGRVRKKGGTTRWILETCTPIVVYDSRKDPHGPNPMLIEGRINSFIGVPIVNKGEAIAVLYGLYSQPRPFDRGELDVLQVLAGLAGVAIGNAKLMRQAKELHEQRKALMRLVVHDLLNPITNIQGFLDLFMSDFGPLSEQHTQWMQIIQRSTTHMQEMIREVARYEQLSEQSRPTRIAVDLTPVCLEVIQQFTPAAQRKELRIAPPDPQLVAEVEGDPILLREVVHNLISNAVKYSRIQDDITVTLKLDADNVLLTVQDTGIGMSEEDQRWIFDPFQRAEAGQQMTEGFGLGLYLVKHIVEQHWGQISLESAPNVGTTMSIRLPKYVAVPPAP